MNRGASRDPGARDNQPPTTPHEIVASGYNKVADQYAELEHGHPWPRMKWLDRLLRRLSSDSDILDVGCGSGIPADAEMAGKHRVVGIDISEEQIRRARMNVPSGTFVCGDVTSATFPEGAFGAIVSFYTIEHLPRRNHDDLLRRLYAWMKPGGYLLLSVEAGDYDDVQGTWLGVPMFISCYGPEAMKEMVQRAGYLIVESAVEVQVEGDHEVPYLWILAKKGESASAEKPDNKA